MTLLNSSKDVLGMHSHLVFHNIWRDMSSSDSDDFSVPVRQRTALIQIGQSFCLVHWEKEHIVQVVFCEKAGVTINRNLRVHPEALIRLALKQWRLGYRLCKHINVNMHKAF